jgi:hypothetical protein
MAAELEALGGEEAVERIDETLAIIAEREEAGFVTEAMVEHRLRLLDVAASLGRPATFQHVLSSSTIGARAARERLAVAEGDELRVRSELIVHGEKTELIAGKPKLQRACFRLWMQLENTSEDQRVVERPTLDASIPLPVSRWFIEDSPGEEWDGVLRAREKRSVLVIGYVGEPVKAGTDVSAVIKLHSLELPATARARNRWHEAI